MRILVCTNAYPPSFVGGAELVAHALAREWQRQGHEVAAFAGDPQSRAERHTLARDVYEGVSVNRVTTTARDYGIELNDTIKPALEQAFQGLLDSFRPDVVHCHNLAGLPPRIPILAAESGTSVFLTLHDYWGFCFRNTLLREGQIPCVDLTGCAQCLFPGAEPGAIELALRVRRDLTDLAFDHVQQLIAPSEHLKSRYVAAGFESERIRVVLNGIESSRFLPKTEARTSGSLRLLYVGYLGNHKGVDVAIRGVALANSAVVLDVIGEGSEFDRLQALALTLGVRDRVRFRGKVRPGEMHAIYHGADAVVLPSIWEENQPVCLMEAMACGLPVIASKIGGIPSMVDDGQEGVLFPPGDHRALAKAIDGLALTPGRAAAMGKLARQRVQQQTYASQAGQLTQLFSSRDAAARKAQLRRSVTAVVGLDPWRVDQGMRERLAASPDYLIPSEWLTPALADKVGTEISAAPRSLKQRFMQARYR